MIWPQRYDPLHSQVLSTAAAALPVVVLLGSLAWLRLRAHAAAALGLLTALGVAIVIAGMPPTMAFASAAYGAGYGLFPIGWIVLNVIFLYQLVEQRGLLDALRRGVSGVTGDRRLQLLLVAFSFGAFMEGAAGFGTPVAVTGGILIALGFGALEASALSLIANTAPVAFGALGTPIVALQAVTGLDLHALSAQVGHQLPVFSLIVPFWLVWAYAGWRGMLEVWPAVLVAGVGFAVPQFLMATLHGPWLVDIVAAACSMGALVAFLKVWKPGTARPARSAPAPASLDRLQVPARGWIPWILLTVLVFLWGLPQVKDVLNALASLKIAVPGLHEMVERVPPVVATPAAEPATFTLNWLSATGSGILLAALLTALVLRYGLRELGATWLRTVRLVRVSLLTIALMMGLGFITRYAGLDGTLGLAFAHTGVLYPFFGTMLGWLGVALTGSDTSSNVLFGSLQTITARQLGLDPVLMAAANSSGGVMGKMIDAQSIVVASTVTGAHGEEGRILRYVFFHSVALAALVGLLVTAQAYW
ncbi:MAG TPA: L-lactate permease [Gemmatimonadales bacterium]|nr:L-lactate permease [Gemmatimonadales bacterium]